MVLLSLLKTLSFVEWIFWGIVFITGIKGYIEYPNLIKNTSKESKTDFSSKSILER